MADAQAVEPVGGARPPWPPWGPDDGYDRLAQFISPLAVAYADLPVAPEELRDNADPRGSDLRVAMDRYGVIAAIGLRPARHPWLPAPGDRQQVRDPAWVRSADGGRCLDLAVLYGSACLEAHVSPLLAVDDHHALIVLRLGWLSDPLRVAAEDPPGTRREGDSCTYVIDDPGRLQDAVDAGEYLAVECTALVDPIRPFEEACRLGRVRLLAGMRLVDADEAHNRGGAQPLEPAGPRPPLSTYAPIRRRPQLLGSQEEALKDILGRSGTVVLHAPRGQGKSTVAQELVRLAPLRAGWFLDASDGAQLKSSMADAELAETSQSAAELTAASRAEYAESAIVRLNETAEPWTVIFDNADAGPASVASLRPRPRRGQLVVVTTVNARWRDAPNVQWVDLAPASEEDVLGLLGDSRLLPLVKGRALLMEAYRRYLDGGGTADALCRCAQNLDPEDEVTGAQALVKAVLGSGAEASRKLAVCCALLPPDRLPRPVLERFDADHALSGLVAAGILDDNELHFGDLQMHRLMGQAVREEAKAALPEACLELTQEPGVLDALDVYADPVTMKTFASELARRLETDADRELGIALHDVAAVLETKGNTLSSSELYEASEKLLDPNLRDDQLRLARCWLGQARAAYQTKADNRAALDRGRGLARKAEELVSEIEEPDAAGRYVAMRGLIQKAAALLAPPAQQLDELERALEVLVDADERRKRWAEVEGGADEAELLRSTYNLAGIRIDIAKLKATDAARLLKEADGIYDQVQDGRVALYGRSLHPHVAACIHGRAIVGYYRAILVDTELSARVRDLREAQLEVLEGLVIREQLSGGEQSSDVHKSLVLLMKIALVRDLLPARRTEAHFAQLGDVTAELYRSGLLR